MHAFTSCATRELACIICSQNSHGSITKFKLSASSSLCKLAGGFGCLSKIYLRIKTEFSK